MKTNSFSIVAITHTACPCTRTRWAAFAALFLTAINAGPIALSQDPAAGQQRFKHQITGLFCPEREQDLRELVVAKFPNIKLIAIDYQNSEATFEYDPTKAFPNSKPEQIVERFDNELRNASRHTFGVKPLSKIPRDKLTMIEIPIEGLDCKACSLAAYEMVARVPGVELAFASFKLRKVTAWIDPTLTSAMKLESILKERGVDVKASR